MCDSVFNANKKYDQFHSQKRAGNKYTVIEINVANKYINQSMKITIFLWVFF